MPFPRRLALAFSCAAVSLSVFGVTGSHAEEPKKPVTDCKSLLEQAGAMIETTPDTKIEPIADGCHATNLVFSANKWNRMKVADVRIAGKNLFESIQALRLPENLEASVSGVRLSPNSGNPLTDYLGELVQSPYTAHLAYRWDRRSNDLIVDDVSLKGARMGDLALSGTVGGVMKLPSMAEQPQDYTMQTSFKKLSARLDNRGVFETMVVVPLVAGLSKGQDPKPMIAGFLQMATSFVDGLPETVASADSKAALKSFIGEFPHPAGLYQFDIEPKQPIPAIEIIGAANEPPILAGLLNKLTISATHQAVAQ